MTDNRDIVRALVRKFGTQLSVESMSLLADIMKGARIRYRTFIMKEGDSDNYIYYIEQGLIRMFRKVDGREITDDIVMEGDMLINDDSVFTHSPSIHYMLTIEPTFIYAIDYEQLSELACRHEDIHRLMIAILEHHSLDQKRRTEMMDLPTYERYLSLLKSRSEIIRRTPLKQVASYLKMKPETLSRIRNAVNKNEEDSNS